jgi:hypothetical protein
VLFDARTLSASNPPPGVKFASVLNRAGPEFRFLMDDPSAMDALKRRAMLRRAGSSLTFF